MNNLPPLTSPNGGIPSGIEPPRTKRSGGCVKGCFFSLLLCIVVCAAGAYLVMQYAGPLLSRGSSALLDKLTTEVITQIPLPPAERARLETELRQFGADVRAGKVGLTELARITEGFTSGSFLPQLLGASFKDTYLKGSSLSAAEKAAADVVVQKFITGIAQSRISKEDANAILKVLSATGATEDLKNLQVKKSLTDTEIRQLLTQMERASRAAGVTGATPNTDLAGELGKALTKGKEAQ